MNLNKFTEKAQEAVVTAQNMASEASHAEITPEAKTLRLKLPAGTQSGQKFRLRGHGLPNVGKPDERGDLYANVEVDVPKSLSDEERKHYEALREVHSKS